MAAKRYAPADGYAGAAELRGPRGQLTPHFFEYEVYMLRLTPTFVNYSDFEPHF